MAPRWVRPKKRGQTIALRTAKKPPKTPKPPINKGIPKEDDKNKNPTEAIIPPKIIKYKQSFKCK